MKITKLRILNYKGLREVEIPLSRFACLIGENNAGKSSVLQAYSLFFSGSALPKTHYFDSSQEVRIELSLSDIDDLDLNRLAVEHRSRIGQIIKNGNLILVRIYGQDGKSTLKYQKLMPSEMRFSERFISELFQGKRAGAAFVSSVVEAYPELAPDVDNSMNQGEMKAAILAFADRLPDVSKVPIDIDLPTGIDKSIMGLLPEPIYIQAVKDLKDDVKTTESTPFGKVLGILLKAIEPLFAEERALFEKLNKSLNRITSPEGLEIDERLDPVKKIEETLEKNVRDSFKAVKLRIAIPPPELKTILSSAQIWANDGVDGLIETKGDGLRRAIVFAILRSFVELGRSGLIPSTVSPTAQVPKYILLFEEPELYLHPKAQQVLFDALAAFSQNHAVVVTTHSPIFFGPAATTTFIKMLKKSDAAISEKPFGISYPIDLGETNARDQFQIICFENNSIAFFSETVVLVEGDSDLIVHPHLAKLINPAWDCKHIPVCFARIGGKSNIRRYKDFFQRFKMRIFIIADLDFLLKSDFGQIGPNEEIRNLRSELLAIADSIILAMGEISMPSNTHIQDAHASRELRCLWENVRALKSDYEKGIIGLEALLDAIKDFFAWERYWARLDILKVSTDPALLVKKRELLSKLRSQGVLVLEKGAIDDYYPPSVVGESKPAKALCFCSTITSKEQAIALCTDGHVVSDNMNVPEFQAIYQTIFSN